MRKFTLLTAVIAGAYLSAQNRPIITRWKTSSDQDKRIAINNEGKGTYTFEKVGDPSKSGNGDLLGGSKVIINLPEPGEYIVKITPNGKFSLKMGFTTEEEASELLELSQWGDVKWGYDASVSNMFTNCKNLTITATDIPDFSRVEDMSNMFYKCFSLTNIPNINSWNVSNVTDMSNMFGYADKFNADNLNNWDTSKVQNMTLMFAGYKTSVFNGDISKWDTSNVRYMDKMFRDNDKFNQDISKWNTSKVLSFEQMFRNAKSFDQNLGTWTIKSSSLTKMFDDSAMSCLNYSKTLKGWAENKNTTNNVTLSAVNIKYGNAGKSFRDILTSQKGWNITGDIHDSQCNVNLSVSEYAKNDDINIENPIKDVLKIFSKNPIISAKIYTMNGELIKSFSKSEISVTNLDKGVYLLIVNTSIGSKTIKVIKD